MKTLEQIKEEERKILERHGVSSALELADSIKASLQQGQAELSKLMERLDEIERKYLK